MSFAFMALIFSEISLLTTVVKEEQEAAATFFQSLNWFFVYKAN